MAHRELAHTDVSQLPDVHWLSRNKLAVCSLPIFAIVLSAILGSAASMQAAAPVSTAMSTDDWNRVYHSTGHRDIVCHQLGQGERRILVVGSLAGNQPLAGELVDRLINTLATDAHGNGDWTIVFVKTANPDGLQAGTPTNSRGVDLNCNFPTREYTPTIAHHATTTPIDIQRTLPAEDASAPHVEPRSTEQTLTGFLNHRVAKPTASAISGATADGRVLHGQARSSRHNTGPYPASEVETRILMRVLYDYRPDQVIYLENDSALPTRIHCIGVANPLRVWPATGRLSEQPVNRPIARHAGDPGSLVTFANEKLGIPALSINIHGNRNIDDVWREFGSELCAGIAGITPPSVDDRLGGWQKADVVRTTSPFAASLSGVVEELEFEQSDAQTANDAQRDPADQGAAILTDPTGYIELPPPPR